MTLDITQDVFESVIARPVLGRGGEHGSLVHLWWSSPQQGDRVVQVYLDGELIEVAGDPGQREVWLMIDRDRDHRIELLAVPIDDPSRIWESHPHRLNHWYPVVESTATVTVIRDERLPIDTRVEVTVDGATSDTHRGAMWPADEHRGGFGGLFGVGEFGRDAVTGPGLGLGELGMGPLGSEGTGWKWRRDDLTPPPPPEFSPESPPPPESPPESHTLEINAVDHRGVSVGVGMTIDPVVIDTLPSVAKTFEIDGGFTLRWTP